MIKILVIELIFLQEDKYGLRLIKSQTIT